ncbi:uncharacterized protein LOC121965690 [Plectropomus leopardus]|uniref:uncharacterized protein LOC121965690 n=1 Tax=Plectropomus leopardus TaxID=160734 RepID=UPI001C4B20E3|nr:uncharacterized protein LOC121965690 [Plectropomus leopardus]
MNARHALICFFLLSALRDTGVISAKILTETEGGNITVECSFGFSGKKKLFCRDECEDGNVLIETEEDTDQSGRYSIKYEKRRFFQYDHLYVTITKLMKSDSGRYRCRLDDSWSSDFLFEIRVKDAPTSSKPNWTLGPVSASVPSASTPTTTQSLTSRSGSSTASSASPEGTNNPHQSQVSPAAGTAAGPLLIVSLTLVVLFIVLSVAVLIFCRKRASSLKGHPVETEYADATETIRVYEEIQEENRGSRPPPVEVFTVYSYAKYVKPNAVGSSDKHSFLTAAAPQATAEDESRKLTYSEVDFPDGAAALLRSAPCGDNVVYSVPRVEASSNGSHGEDASPPLYSTVSLHPL